MKRLRYLSVLFLASCYIESSSASNRWSYMKDNYNDDFSRISLPERSRSNADISRELMPYHHSNNNPSTVYPVPYPGNFSSENIIKVPCPEIFSSKIETETNKARELVSKIEDKLERSRDQDRCDRLDRSLVEIRNLSRQAKENLNKAMDQLTEQLQKIGVSQGAYGMQVNYHQQVTDLNHNNRIQMLEMEYNNKIRIIEMENAWKIKDLTEKNQKLENKLHRLTNDTGSTQRGNFNRYNSSAQTEIERILKQERDQTRQTLTLICTLIEEKGLLNGDTLRNLKRATQQSTIGHDEICQIIRREIGQARGSLYNLYNRQESEDDD